MMHFLNHCYADKKKKKPIVITISAHTVRFIPFIASFFFGFLCLYILLQGLIVNSKLVWA